MRTELKVCGNGGQGVITVGMLLTRAATLHENIHASCTESYGPQSRGGDVWVEVILDRDEPIDYPRVTRADALVSLNMMSHKLYSRQLKPGGALLYDPTLVPLKPGPNQWPIPCFQEAARAFQRTQVANLIMLGALLEVARPISREALEKAIRERFPAQAETNLQALEHGAGLARGLAKTPGGDGHAAAVG